MIEADPLITKEEVTGLAMGIEETKIMVTMITETMEIMRTRILKMVTTRIMEMLEIMEILIGIKYSVKSATSLATVQLIAITSLIQIM